MTNWHHLLCRLCRNYFLFDAAAAMKIGNGVPIPNFISNPDDNALLELMPLLYKLAVAKDVRPILRQVNNEYIKSSLSLLSTDIEEDEATTNGEWY